jgi:acyl carrier protein
MRRACGATLASGPLSRPSPIVWKEEGEGKRTPSGLVVRVQDFQTPFSNGEINGEVTAVLWFGSDAPLHKYLSRPSGPIDLPIPYVQCGAQYHRYLVEDIKDGSTLDDLGIDSLMATELLNDVRAAFGVTIDLTTLLFFPNMRAAWKHLAFCEYAYDFRKCLEAKWCHG